MAPCSPFSALFLFVCPLSVSLSPSSFLQLSLWRLLFLGLCVLALPTASSVFVVRSVTVCTCLFSFLSPALQEVTLSSFSLSLSPSPLTPLSPRVNYPLPFSSSSFCLLFRSMSPPLPPFKCIYCLRVCISVPCSLVDDVSPFFYTSPSFLSPLFLPSSFYEKQFFYGPPYLLGGTRNLRIACKGL